MERREAAEAEEAAAGLALVRVVFYGGIEDSGINSIEIQLPRGTKYEIEWGVRSTNSKLVLQKVKGQTVQGQMAQEF